MSESKKRVCVNEFELQTPQASQAEDSTLDIETLPAAEPQGATSDPDPLLDLDGDYASTSPYDSQLVTLETLVALLRSQRKLGDVFIEVLPGPHARAQAVH